jgi:Nidogen-like/GDSL-like Lipase/Acylhydrolase family
MHRMLTREVRRLTLLTMAIAASALVPAPAVSAGTSKSHKTRPNIWVQARLHVPRHAGHARLRAHASSFGAVVNDPNCATNTLPANDDGSTGQVALPFRLNFYGSSYTSLWVNNNGNVTFTGPLGTYTPFAFNAATPPIIAPFFGDVDTRGGGGLVTYGRTTYQGRAAFCVDWPNVGYYSVHTDKLNDFQLLLVDRSDIAAGDFEIVFNYNQIQWETGDASGGFGGLGGTSAGVGFANGDGANSHFFSLPGSLQNGALLDSNLATGLVHNAHGTTVLGRYIFPIVNGAPITTSRYVALGDSVPYGMGLVNPSANQGPSRNAYPQYVDQGLPGLRPLSYRPTGCGLTGDQLAVSGAPSIDNAWTGGNSDCGLLVHEAVFTDEVAAASLRSSPPALVTIQAGADDANFSGCLAFLLGVPSGVEGSEKCITRDAYGYHLTSKVMSELRSLSSGLTDTINFIHRNAPTAQIVVVNYYQIIPGASAALTGTSTICRDLRFSSQGGNWRQSIRAEADFFQQQLNGTIRSAASQFPDVVLADISGLMNGHEMCTLNSWEFDGISNNSAGHPNATGQWYIGQTILSVCRRRPRQCIGR